MKKTTAATSAQNLTHIQKHHLQTIANTFHCTPKYVYMIVNGERTADSVMARRVLAAARVLNNAIEKALSKKEFTCVETD